MNGKFCRLKQGENWLKRFSLGQHCSAPLIRQCDVTDIASIVEGSH